MFLFQYANRRDRSSFVIATKVRFGKGFIVETSHPHEIGLSRGTILNHLENSLKRLQTDYIDLYYVSTAIVWKVLWLFWLEGDELEHSLLSVKDWRKRNNSSKITKKMYKQKYIYYSCKTFVVYGFQNCRESKEESSMYLDVWHRMKKRSEAFN